MSTTAAPALGNRIASCLRAFDFERLAHLYRADALLDVSVPQWRFQLQGQAAICQWLREEIEAVGGAGRVASWRVTPTFDGLVVEWEVQFTRDGEEHLWREVHLFHTDGEVITEHVNYCTGIWDAATIARQAVEAPMVAR
jgi:hypothetical protein